VWFAEVCRILKPRGTVIVSFSNRMSKGNRRLGEIAGSRPAELVKRYFASVPGFGPAEVIVNAPSAPRLPVAELAAGDPFMQ